MKPLYIENRNKPRVHLEDPALVVQRENEAERLFPLNRIGRVISHEKVRWTQASLLALAKHGIPLIFHDNRGKIIARLLGLSGEPGSLVRQLEETLTLPYGPERYIDWYRHNERRILLELRSAHPWLAIPLNDPDRLHSVILKMLREKMARNAATMSRNYIENRVHAWVSQHLGVLGIDASTPHLLGGVIDLPRDLSRLLQWHFMVSWVEWVSARQIQGLAVSRKVTEHFHRLETDLERQGRQLLNHLHLWASNPEWR